MMFVLRTIFWFAVVMYCLQPAPKIAPQSQLNPGPRSNAIATTALNACVTHPRLCQAALETAQHVVQPAQASGTVKTGSEIPLPQRRPNIAMEALPR